MGQQLRKSPVNGVQMPKIDPPQTGTQSVNSTRQFSTLAKQSFSLSVHFPAFGCEPLGCVLGRIPLVLNRGFTRQKHRRPRQLRQTKPRDLVSRVRAPEGI